MTPKHGDTRTRFCGTCDAVIIDVYHEADHTGHPQTWRGAGWEERWPKHTSPYSCVPVLADRIRALERNA
jgi:hypothetical protein